MNAGMQPPQDRLLFIDIARSLAIVLALSSHALSIYRPDFFVNFYTHVSLMTIMATPLFVFMFGFMIDFIYVRRASESGMYLVARTLAVRSFQCYLCYASVAVAGLLGGYMSLNELSSALLLIGDAKYGNILRTYSLALLLMIPLIQLRRQFGPAFLFVSLLLVYASFMLISPDLTQEKGVADFMLSRLLGIGSLPGGPSLLHSFNFIFAGMIIASGAREGTQRFFMNSAVVLLFLTFVLVFNNSDTIGTVVRSLAYGTYRSTNDIRYFALTTIGTIVLLLVLRALPKNTLRHITAKEHFIALGRSSLLSFTVGNILLCLTGLWINRYLNPAICFVLFFVLLSVLVKNHTRTPYYMQLRRLLYFHRAIRC